MADMLQKSEILILENKKLGNSEFFLVIDKFVIVCCMCHIDIWNGPKVDETNGKDL